jgi:monoamine oxidase
MTHKYDAEKAIITVPLPILTAAAASASINFTPPLDDYIKAAEEIGMGEVIKIVLQFKQRFWKEDTGFVLTDETFPTWWTQLPDETQILTGWAGGTKAEQFHGHSDDEILEKALFSLAAIFNKTISELKENLQQSWIFNWQKDVHSMGAYSYSMPNSDISRKILNLPVADTIYFAGEALYDGESPGTVEAALASGKKVAENIKSKM